MKRKSLTENIAPPEKAYLVGIEWKAIPDGKYHPEAWYVEDSLEELFQLADTAGLEVIGQITQKLEKPNSATFIGKGKAEELAAEVRDLGIQVVIFDDELAPRHQRELEKVFGEKVKVMDRTGLILDIFAQHASTREGTLQVELAQYAYRLPRLTQFWTDATMTRQAGGRAGGGTGGVGLRGPGQTQLEMDRFAIRRRIAKIKKDLAQVRSQRARHRSSRRKSGLPTVALVGYTNAGKSTLLNALSGSNVYAADQLFATLDPTTRRVVLPGGTVVLLSDTVGFIQKLPTDLIAAFRATLEEIIEADVLLHVIDASHPQAMEQVRAVFSTLKEIGADELPVINVLNKIDLFDDPDSACDALGDLSDTVAISAMTGVGLDALMAEIELVLESEMRMIEVLLPFSRGDLVSMLHERGLIDSEEHRADGTLIYARVPDYLAEQFESYVMPGSSVKPVEEDAL